MFKELKKLVQTLQEVEDPSEFLESVRGELYDPDIYVLTPTGEVRELPRGSTPIDFAYSIHSAVGDKCSGARVNGQIVPLRHELQNGDIVEIITSKNQHPRRAWLQYVKTSRARTCIRQYLRREEKEKALRLGREICERELRKHDVALKKLIKSGHIKMLLKKLRCNSLDDMLVKVGSGAITVAHLTEVLEPPETREEKEQRARQELLEKNKKAESGKGTAADSEIVDIDGLDDMLVRVSQCCKPVPGDEIVGFITTGRGISVHKADCPNLRTTDPRRWIAVRWSGSPKATHRSALLIRAENQKNLLVEISSTINADDAEIVELNSRITSENLVEMEVVVQVSDLNHLQTLQQHLQQMPVVIEVRRR
nr:TGS domain-containing protein [Desulfolithobacter dissulfuricans]